jgi:hypothetical protein
MYAVNVLIKDIRMISTMSDDKNRLLDTAHEMAKGLYNAGIIDEGELRLCCDRCQIFRNEHPLVPVYYLCRKCVALRNKKDGKKVNDK